MSSVSFVKIRKNTYGCISKKKHKSNFFVVLDEPQLILIDTGYKGDICFLKQILSSLGKDISEVTDILLTHADGDHVGSLKEIVEASNADVWASKKTKVYLAKARNPAHFPFPINILTFVGHKFGIGRNVVHHCVKDGDYINLVGGIKVIATPGHTDDHTSYFLEKYNILFAGDCLSNIKRIKIPASIINQDWHVTVESARKLINLSPGCICVGHGSIWNETIEQDVKNMIELKQAIDL